MSKHFRMTTKQRTVIDLVIKAHPDGSFLDLEELHELLPWDSSKASLLSQLKYLIQHGMVERGIKVVRRGASRVLIVPTFAARALWHSAGYSRLDSSFKPEKIKSSELVEEEIRVEDTNVVGVEGFSELDDLKIEDVNIGELTVSLFQ